MPATIDPAVADADGLLDGLVVAEPAPERPPYERDDYDGGGWDDLDGDCLSTRHEILTDTSTTPAAFDGCRVVTGTWIDAYTGAVLTTAGEATIDHLIPLSEAHRSGAWRWDLSTRRSFANDQTPGSLLVVADEVNQSKADKTPDRWLPPDPAAHCQYALDWVNAKHRYQLTVTVSEASALRAVLDSCDPDDPVRPAVPVDTVAVVTTQATTTTTTTVAAGPGPGSVVLVACERRSEEVTIANPGGLPVSLDGFLLHDEGRKHEVALGRYGTLDPGARLIVTTGPDAVDATPRVVWKNQNVWNNDGDTAHLLAPDGTTTTQRC